MQLRNQKYRNVEICYESRFKYLDVEKIIVGKSKDKPSKHLEIMDHIVELDVGDYYEDLPKKTLAMIKWFLENSTAEYLFKIDDD